MTTPAPAGVEMALRFFKAGGLSFEPGDKFEPRNIPDMDELSVSFLRKQHFVGNLNREAYEACMTMRPLGAIGAGFTEAFLYAAGILEPKAAPKPDATPKMVFGETDKLISPTVAVRQRDDLGAFKLFQLFDVETGKPLSKNLRSMPKVIEKAAEILGVSTDSLASTMAESEQTGQAHDLQLQHQSG